MTDDQTDMDSWLRRQVRPPPPDEPAPLELTNEIVARRSEQAVEAEYRAARAVAAAASRVAPGATPSPLPGNAYGPPPPPPPSPDEVMRRFGFERGQVGG